MLLSKYLWIEWATLVSGDTVLCSADACYQFFGYIDSCCFFEPLKLGVSVDFQDVRDTLWVAGGFSFALSQRSVYTEPVEVLG